MVTFALKIYNLEIAVLIACHNRRVQTLRCLESLHESMPQDWKFEVFLVDDGSKDGTSKLVEEKYPNTKLILGPGNWFWARSMAEAEKHAGPNFDAYLWLNDDVKLFADSLHGFRELALKRPSAILVGQTRFSDSQTLSYGGYLRFDRHPFHLKHIESKHEPILADTFNGNIVFVPMSASRRVGAIDGGFAHAYADIDYGYRAKKHGIDIVIVPGFSGVCNRNASKPENPIIAVINLLKTKNLPVKSQVRFLRRHGGVEWPVYIFLPYIRTLINSSLAWIRNKM